MKHDDVKLLLPAVAFGSATEAELDLVHEHLAECAVCEEQLVEFVETAGLMSAAAAPIAAPAHLKERIMAQIAAESASKAYALLIDTPAAAAPVRAAGRGWGSLWPQSLRMPRMAMSVAAAAACIVLVAVVALSSFTDPQGPVSPIRQQARQIAVQLAPGADSALQDVSMRVAGDQVRVAGAPDLPDTRDWQLWALDSKGTPHSIGIVDGRLSAELPEGSVQVAITQEPAGGSQAPTTAPVLTARV